MPKRVAIQGFEGCFHQIAAQNYFGKQVDIVPCVSFSEIVKKVSLGQADSGVMAIENSTAGSILPNYDLLQRSDLFVVGEIYLHIRQHLITLPGVSFKEIKEVHSHPMALLQCRPYLEEHPAWRLVETEDTALSAKHLRQYNSKHVAAIASSLSANLYNLNIIKRDVHFEKKNYTRFLILNREEKQKDVKLDHKASLYFQVENQSGCLARVLGCIGENQINLSKLQSFPIPGLDWQYYFHADLEFFTMDQFEEVMECIKPITKRLRILGIYNKGRTCEDEGVVAGSQDAVGVRQ